MPEDTKSNFSVDRYLKILICLATSDQTFKFQDFRIQKRRADGRGVSRTVKKKKREMGETNVPLQFVGFTANENDENQLQFGETGVFCSLVDPEGMLLSTYNFKIGCMSFCPV